MTSRRGTAGVWALAFAVVCAIALIARDEGDASRVVVAALESDEAAALCAHSGAKLSDFWARAKILGVSAAVMRPHSLADSIRRGEILRFERAEVERWKAAGLLSPSATLRPDTAWTKDARLFDLLRGAASQAGVAFTSETLAGFHVMQAPELRSDLPLAGYDPEGLAAAEGLAQIQAGAMGLEIASWPVGGSRAALLRKAFGRPRRLLVFHLYPESGMEANIDALRAALRDLARRGAPLATSFPAPPPPQSGAWRLALAGAGAWLLGVLGPLLAARGGLLALRWLRSRALERWPVLSPVLQLCGGLAATAALAALAGLVVHACAAAGLAPLSSRWAFASLAGPLAIATLTLYTVDLEAWRRSLAKPMTYAALLKLLALACALALLLQPRWALSRLGVWGCLRAFGASLPSALWWWPWRWREILVGVPALVQALFLVNWRLECPDCASLPVTPVNDPRGWFLLGLLAPIGVVVSVGQGAFPEMLALSQTFWALLFGAAFGAGGVALRLRVAHIHAHERVDGPKDP